MELFIWEYHCFSFPIYISMSKIYRLPTVLQTISIIPYVDRKDRYPTLPTYSLFYICIEYLNINKVVNSKERK